jgi:hypothetical protein
MFWAGIVASAIPVLMLLISGATKLMKPPMVLEGFGKYGYAENVITPLGIVELACTVLYIIPQTCVLRAILLTGYLGGAVATHVRAGESFAGPAIFGVLVWIGLFLRDRRVRTAILRRLEHEV